ncbi:MAG: molybdopterin-dependent oxidoreductase, partial [Acidimicrobiia bacterium]|nr:molybdopterin-dependent oxidoreductase [Acidimicrobiia bacterium]
MDRPALSAYPPVERWDDWEEYDAKAWPKRVRRRYRLVPTTCFNCEAGCGLLAYVDKDSGEVRRFEGNPEHPGSRGRNCAKGPATLNQMYDPERILHPLHRVGDRGDGKWEQVGWEEALEDIAGRIGKALAEGRHDEIMYHVGRPGEDGFVERVLRAWGVDGHNSHTNICSSGARTGYAMWMGYDRPSADFAHARFILLLSAQLESGHYFNPHAQRIIEARQGGAQVATIDPRLSNTASMSDFWLSPWPGTEAAMLLAIASRLLEWDAVDHDFVRRWVNWEDSLQARAPDRDPTYENFVDLLKETYRPYTLDYAAEETGVEIERIEAVAKGIAAAGHRFASHTWRAAGSGNLGGWQVARCLFFLHVLTGSVGTRGGTSPSAWDKFKPEHWNTPPPSNQWNELIWPNEFPLSHYEMSYLLPHFLKERRGRLEVYFTRVYNPVWTNPDGFTWLEMLKDTERVGLHVALSPTWSETAWFADYILPMGVGSERHDTMSYETHAGRWLGFRQPVLRVAGERDGQSFERTYQANPGEVWEENEFWIDLSWRIDPDGKLGVRRWFESPEDPTRPVSVDEYYGWMFNHSVPGLPEQAEKEGLTPLAYMRKYGAFEIDRNRYELNETPASADQPGVERDGKRLSGFTSPSHLLEWHSDTLREWGWEEVSVPTYVKSHVYWRNLDLEGNERILV